MSQILTKNPGKSLEELLGESDLSKYSDLEIKEKLEKRMEYLSKQIEVTQMSPDELQALSLRSLQNKMDAKTYPLTIAEKAQAQIATEKVSAMEQAFTHLNAIKRRTDLNKMNQSDELAKALASPLPNSNPLEELLQEQAAALHQAGMGILAKVYDYENTPPHVQIAINGATKLFRAFQGAVQTLHQIKHGTNQTITVKHQNVQVNGGQNVITDDFNSILTKATTNKKIQGEGV